MIGRYSLHLSEASPSKGKKSLPLMTKRVVLMEYLFANLICGHIVGDYFLQPKKMAILKSEQSLRGFAMCSLHCVIYTLSICCFLWDTPGQPLLLRNSPSFSWPVILIVYISHFPFDFWGLGDKWLRLIKGRNILDAFESREKYHLIDLIFSCIVYTIVDNGFHIIIMFQILK